MSFPKQNVKVQISQQRKTYTFKLSKKQANYIKAALPQRYSIQLYSQRNDRNSPKSCFQANKNLKSKGKCKNNTNLESPGTIVLKEKTQQNAKHIQIEKIRQNQCLAAMEQKNAFLPNQEQITILKDSIMKFFEAMWKSFQKKREIENSFRKIKQNFRDNSYRNFIEFEHQIKTIIDKIILENPKEKVLNEFNKILGKIELYFKQLSIKRNQQQSKLQNKKQCTQKIVEPSPQKKSKNAKKTIKVAQKQLKSRNVKGKFQKKNVILPQVLFAVAEETQSSINSTIQIDSFEAGRINDLLNKLHIIEQQEIIKTISQQGRIKSIKNLNCREAKEFAAKIKKMLRKNSRKELNEENYSSFQVEDQE